MPLFSLVLMGVDGRSVALHAIPACGQVFVAGDLSGKFVRDPIMNAASDSATKKQKQFSQKDKLDILQAIDAGKNAN